MQRGPFKALISVGCLALAAAGAYRLAGMDRAGERLVVAADLRDAVGDGGSGDLASRHAGLAVDSRASCSLCHMSRSGAARAGAWSSALGEPLRDAMSSPKGMDTPSSRMCLACHDGSVGRGNGPEGAGGRSHPIGADYRAVWAGAPGDYNPPGANIRLEDGKVGCVSCHHAHARPGQGVSRTGVAQDSCQSCHRR